MTGHEPSADPDHQQNHLSDESEEEDEDDEDEKEKAEAATADDNPKQHVTP